MDPRAEYEANDMMLSLKGEVAALADEVDWAVTTIENQRKEMARLRQENLRLSMALEEKGRRRRLEAA